MELNLKQKYTSLLDAHLPNRPIFDSTGAFLKSELELLDPTLHLPLTWTTFAEDLLPREGLSIDDEFASWTNSTYGSAGSFSTTGKSWLGVEAQDSADVGIDIRKAVNEIGIWSKSASWTFVELSRSQKLQRPIDVDKLQAIQNIWNLDVDNQAYLGDVNKGLFGLANADTASGNTADWAVTNSTNAITGGWVALLASSPSTAANLILNDLNALDNSIYTNSGWTSPATKFLVPASVWYVLNVPLVIAGVPIAMSIKDYFEQHSIAATQGRKIQILPRKWLASSIPGTNYGNNLSANRVVGYTDDYDYIRMEYTPLLHTPVWIQGMRQSVTYYGGLGGVEILRPSTLGYLNQV